MLDSELVDSINIFFSHNLVPEAVLDAAVVSKN